MFSAIGVRRTPSQGSALALAAKTAGAIRVETTGQWGPRADVRRSSSQGAALALAAKTAEAMRIVTGQWRPCPDVRRSPRQGAALAVAAKAHDVMEVHHVLADPEEETHEAPSDSEEETREAPSDPEEETREVPSDHEEEAKDIAGPTELEGSVVPSLRKLTISGNLSPIMLSRTRSRRVHTDVEGAALQSLLPATEGGDEEGDESTSVCNGGGPMPFQVKVDIQQSTAGDISSEPINRKRVMHSSEWEEWRKAEEVENARYG